MPQPGLLNVNDMIQIENKLSALDARIAALEDAPSVVEPPVEPPIEPPVEPPTIPDGELDARYAALLDSPNLHSAAAFNSASDIVKYTRPPDPNKNFTYDPVENAARCDTATMGISSMWQLRVDFPKLDKDNCEMLSVQWQTKIDSSYDDTAPLQNYKAFQLAPIGGNLMFEYQWNFLRAKPGAAALPLNRMYRNVAYSEAVSQEPLKVIGPEISPKTGRPVVNWQPGGDAIADYNLMPFGREDHLDPAKLSPYVLPLDQWITYTTDFMFVNGELRCRIWISDEETPATLVLEGADGNGFILSNDTSAVSMEFANWWIEMNSSQNGGFDHEKTCWVKNFIAYKDAPVPR